MFLLVHVLHVYWEKLSEEVLNDISNGKLSEKCYKYTGKNRVRKFLSDNSDREMSEKISEKM